MPIKGKNSEFYNSIRKVILPTYRAREVILSSEEVCAF
jgi:hypothetical protein